MTDSDLSYTSLCPNCGGHFSIPIEKIPPVQARFRCLHCKQPMDFPARDEARAVARRQTEAGIPVEATAGRDPVSRHPAPPPLDDRGEGLVGEATRFRVQKSGFETDIYDRRAVRNLIRAGQILEEDRVCVDDGDPVPAGELPYLQSLFTLRKKARGHPPICCRTHTEKIAFFQCHETARPLCEDCAAERKFGGTTIRVCLHCGGPAAELVQA